MPKERTFDDDVLKFFLLKLEKEELVEEFISIIQIFCEGEPEHYKEITKAIVTNIQAREIMQGKRSLDDYKEPHRSELKKVIDEVDASLKGTMKRV